MEGGWKKVVGSFASDVHGPHAATSQMIWWMGAGGDLRGLIRLIRKVYKNAFTVFTPVFFPSQSTTPEGKVVV